MNKKNLLSLALCATSSVAFAGGYLTNTNQNIAYNRNFARNASTEIDAAYSNPAGLAWMADGFHLSLNIQSASQKRNIETTFMPFAGNLNYPGDATGKKLFEGEASAPVIPSFQGVYKQDRWALSTSFGITGGGGKCTFNQGLPQFESAVSMIPALLKANGLDGVTGYSFDTYMRGRQYVFGLQLGLTYTIIDPEQTSMRQGLSAYAGARMNYVNNAYEGYVRNISVQYADQIVNVKDMLINYSEQALAASKQYEQAAANYEQAGMMAEAAQANAQKEAYFAAAAKYAGYAEKAGDIELDCTQTGWGLTPIIGVDYRIGNWNFGARYEFMTNLNIENDTKINTTGSKAFDHGVNTPNDLPAILTLGAQCDVVKNVRLMAGWTHYFDKDAGMAGDKQKALDKNTNEILAGAEWTVSDRLLVSAGWMKTIYGQTDGFQSDLSFSCDSYSVGLGAKVKLNDKTHVNVAYFWTNYDDYEMQTANFNGTGVPGSTVYSRTNKVFGLGIDYTF